MAFLIRKPFIFIIIGIIVVVILIITFTGVFTPKPTIALSASLQKSTISASKNENSTLTILLENKVSNSHKVELHIVYGSDKIKFYDKINATLLPNPVQNPKNLTITYPKTMDMLPNDKLTISLLIKGLDPGVDSYTYSIYLEAWSDGSLSDRQSIQLTVTHT